MKKILIIAESNMSLSGVPVVYMSIVRALHKNYNFDILILKDNDMFFKKEFLSYGGNIYFFSCPKPKKIIKKCIWYAFNYNKEFKKFLRQNNINLGQYSAIHSFNEFFSYPFFKQAQKLGVKKCILHICSAASAYPAKKTVKQLFWNGYRRRALKYCTNILFVSERSMRYNNYKNKGSVLYNVYDEDKYDKIINSTEEKLILTQIGTFSARKNQLFSIEVFKLVQKEYPNSVLNIVGKSINDGYAEKMMDVIESSGLKENIRVLDTKTDRIELSKNTSFILYPSIQDSFGLVLIESQASGIHCFASDLIPNDANMGNVDFLKLDPKLWSEKIIGYYKLNGNKRVEPINKNKFSLQTFRNNLMELYK